MQAPYTGTIPPPGPPPQVVPTGALWPPPPPPRPGTPAWAIVLVVVVVVVVLVVAGMAMLYVMRTGLGPGGAHPVATFGAPSPLTNGFQFDVAAVSMTRAAANYRVALSVNGTSAGSSATLAASVTIGGYAITWTDLGGERDLTGGDAFRVTRASFPPNSDFVFTLLWSDGSSVGSRDYSS